MLKVVVESAKGIPKKTLGIPDPIAAVIFKGEKKKTKAIDKELNPVWNEIIEFDLKGTPLDSSSFIDVVVKDYETIGKDKFIGSAKISLKELAAGQTRSLPSKNIPLINEKKQEFGATICLMIGYEPPASTVPNPNDQNMGDKGVDSDEDAGDVAEPGAPGVSPSGQPKKMVRTTRKRQKTLSNKPQDFQIRVRVIEGRQLTGNNIKPVVRVNVCGQTHRTRIRRGNNPFFDEVFWLSMSPSDFVYNAYSLRADSLMGEFKCDLFALSGVSLTGHAIMRKWLLLSDPDDSISGARGYLKVSMFIVGTGDEPPVEKREANEEQDDIESNLLLPAGVSLRWATLSLKIYRAEDMPQMDDAFAQTVKSIFGGTDDKKNLVDPFLEVSFAGKKVCTKIVEKNANPEWNQLVHLQVKFPSMCECIKLTVFDWDRLSRNDVIGTTYLNLTKIASSGGEIEVWGVQNNSLELDTTESEVGFLPAFGPCYVNLYGSPREFTGLPDPYEDLNYGKGEGVAYRGRVLIDISHTIASWNKHSSKYIFHIDSQFHQLKILVLCTFTVQKYQRRRKYSLCAVFHSSCMLQEPGEPIQFEVSIGNYGNKLDSTCKPLASTTQFSCAVFDGNHYYYLPWADSKPVVILTSFWEDISHRLDAVNIILYISDRLQANIVSLKTALLAKVSDSRLAEIWLKLITQLIDDLSSYQLPDLEGKPNLTALDIQIKNLRDKTVASVKEAAIRMREEAVDVRATMPDIEDWLERIQQITEEPQNSMPDVIIWMLRGENRVAYARIPANQVLYSTHSEQAIGKYCGRMQSIFMQYPMDKNKGLKIPVQLRVNMWLGLSAHEKNFNSFAEGTFSVFAEMYENQAQVFGKWGTTGLVGRHKFSDVTGKVKLKQERFMPPRSWEWEGDWFIDPERCLLTEADAGHSEFTDEVYQNETRFPGGEWKPAAEPFTDVNGEKAQNPQEIECPPGWIWEDDWNFDSNRAVDEKGWEYGVTIPPDDKPKSWVAAEKMYHIHRRKRLVRPRRKISDTPTTEVRTPHYYIGDGWEYSSLIGWKFHRKERSSDTFRRRRWRRKMAPAERVGPSAIFNLEGALGIDEDEKGSKKDTAKLFGANTPTVFCRFDKSFIYHLRVYVYQAKNLLPMDKDSFSVSTPHGTKPLFLMTLKSTETLRPSLITHPVLFWKFMIMTKWYDSLLIQTLAFGESSKSTGKDEPMGRCTCPPVVKLNPATSLTPKLLWFPITMKGRNAGEMLVAAELLLKDKANDVNLPLVPPRRSENLYMVPQGIRPVVQLTAVEILAWGLRNMKAYQLAAVSSPSLIVECGGQTVQTAIIKNIKKNPNFPGSVLFLKVLLPKDEMYTPPIVLKVIDHRPFGRKPVVGQCTINSLEEFRCDPYISTTEVAMSAKVAMMAAAPRDVVIDMGDRMPSPSKQVQRTDLKDTVDWWSKFYASINEHEKCGPYLQKGYDTLTVYNTELEAVPEFRGLTDFCTTFKLQRGKTEDEEEDPSVVGEFKGSFRVYPLSDDPNVSDPPRQFRELPESCPQECLVRIYIIRCLDLQPKDNNGMCDPYIKIYLGKKMIDDRDHYKPNTLNPEFGRVFELSCYIPQDKDLKISIYDYDLLSSDEKVGETIIDLENRLLSRFGSHCGITKSYCVSGVNQWRDQLKPSQILENLARMRGIPAPQIADDGSFLSFGGREYRLDELEANKTIHPHLGPPKERICLHVLRRQGLVPEHVETRTLYSTYQPTLSQGKIQMWVEIFPKSLGIPGPLCDITPRKPKKYFLRIIVWNTTEVILDETSITGENMSDIYVKGWMPGMEEDKQKTDVHYRSLDGDGNFNWRFVFGFDYLPAEQLCLVSRKDHFWNLDKTEFRIPPKLIIQVWDNDKFSLDDYLGTVELDMLHLIPPAKTPEKCSLSMLTQTGKNLTPTSLFSQKSVRGWWPCAMEEDGKKILAGKVEMTLEVVEEEEAEERPAGKGRDEPNMNPKLDPPNRPDTSFLWFTNPCKTMKFIIWRRYKWLFIGLIILILMPPPVVLFLSVVFNYIPRCSCCL
uniref:Myoferlin-like n=1 Tax=Sinocyclocheilus rhinocerous TaxID=307959 RepID=A0A673FXM7_9TELE